jgi:hypothetical protein
MAAAILSARRHFALPLPQELKGDRASATVLELAVRDLAGPDLPSSFAFEGRLPAVSQPQSEAEALEANMPIRFRRKSGLNADESII